MLSLWGISKKVFAFSKGIIFLWHKLFDTHPISIPEISLEKKSADIQINEHAKS